MITSVTVHFVESRYMPTEWPTRTDAYLSGDSVLGYIDAGATTLLFDSPGIAVMRGLLDEIERKMATVPMSAKEVKS